MNIYDSLDNIRSKPVAVRRQIVFILSAIITILIFVAWGVNVALISNPKLDKSVTATTTQDEVIESENFNITPHLERIKLGGQKIINSIKELR